MISLVIASLSSIFCGLSAVLTKSGMGNNDPHRVNAVSNTIIFLMFVSAATAGGTWQQIVEIEHWDLILSSGAMLGLSWVFYYLGLKDGQVSGILAIQNLSIIFTMVLAYVMLNESITMGMIAGAVFIAVGTILMTELDFQPRKRIRGKGKKWILYELLSSLSVSVSFVLTKMEGTEIDSNLSSLFRYAIVTVMMWGIVVALEKGGVKKPLEQGRTRNRIVQGALCLGLAYILFYEALSLGNTIIVTTLFRMSIIVSTLASALCLKEELSLRKGIGLGGMIIGLVIFVQ